jgi:hypothetical protein
MRIGYHTRFAGVQSCEAGSHMGEGLKEKMNLFIFSSKTFSLYGNQSPLTVIFFYVLCVSSELLKFTDGENGW